MNTKRRIIQAAIIFLLVTGNAGVSRAEVKKIQMKIAGYLCGN